MLLSAALIAYYFHFIFIIIFLFFDVSSALSFDLHFGGMVTRVNKRKIQNYILNIVLTATCKMVDDIQAVELLKL